MKFQDHFRVLMRNRDSYQRRLVIAASSGLLHPGFSYSRTGPSLIVPKSSTQWGSYPITEVPLEWDGTRLGYRFDPTWTQSALWASDLSNATWSKTRATVTNVTAAHPFGGSTISKLVEDTTASSSHIAQSTVITSISGSSYTARALLYPDGRNFAALCFTGAAGGSDRGIFVNLQTGVVTGAFSTYPSSYGATLRSDGGVDLFITEAAPGAASYAARIYLCSASNTSLYTGDGVSGVRVAALNFTNTQYPVPFCVTQGTADSPGNPSLTANLSSIGIPALGTSYSLSCSYTYASALSTSSHVVRIDDTSEANRALFYRPSNGTSVSSLATTGNLGVYTGAFTSAAGTLNKQTMRVSLNNMRTAYNGSLGTADDGASAMPVGLSRVVVGHGSVVGNSHFAGRIHELALFPSQSISDSDLVAMSN